MKLLHKKILICVSLPFLALILMRAIFLFYDFLFQANSANGLFAAGATGCCVIFITVMGCMLVITEGDKFL